jgi:hypothetical protein
MLDGTCRDGTCPTIYATDRGTYVIQGYVVGEHETDGQLKLAEGETVVEIPGELLRRFAGDL